MKTHWKSHNDTYNLHKIQLKDERRSGMVRKKLNITTQVLITSTVILFAMKRQFNSSLTTTTDEDENDSCFTSSTTLKLYFCTCLSEHFVENFQFTSFARHFDQQMPERYFERFVKQFLRCSQKSQQFHWRFARPWIPGNFQ